MTKKRKVDDKNTDRIPTAPIWETIGDNYNFLDSNVPLDKIPAIKYTKGIDWLTNRFEEYLNSNIENISINEVMLILSKTYNEHLKRNNIQEEPLII